MGLPLSFYKQKPLLFHSGVSLYLERTLSLFLQRVATNRLVLLVQQIGINLTCVFEITPRKVPHNRSSFPSKVSVLPKTIPLCFAFALTTILWKSWINGRL